MINDTLLGVVARTPLFCGMDTGAVSALLEAAGYTERAYFKGDVIYSPTNFRRELGIVLTGAVTVTKGPLTVSELRPGELFGAAALFTDGARYVATLTVREKCSVLFLTQGSVTALLDRDSSFRANYISYLAQRIRFLSAKVDALSVGSGGDKLSSYILQNADGDSQLTVRSMTELASRLGIGRASLYRELTKLKTAGIITQNGKNITLLKPELLK